MVMRARDKLQLRMSEAVLMCASTSHMPHCQQPQQQPPVQHHHSHQQQHSSSSSSTERVELRHKPLKRKGLSKFYASKSQSFSSLELALSTQFGESALGLAKRPSSYDLLHAMCSMPLPVPGCARQHTSMDDTEEQLARSLTSSSGLTGLHHAHHGGSGGRRSMLASTCPSLEGPLADALMPCWLGHSTEELCAALRSSSLESSAVQDVMGSSPGVSVSSVGGAGHQLHHQHPRHPHRHQHQQHALPRRSNQDYAAPHHLLAVGNSEHF